MLKIVPATLAWCLLFPLASVCVAQSGPNVAVVINENSPASIQIGEYYAKKREVPTENIIRIKTAIAEEISRQHYSTTIESPIASALGRARIQDRILYIVLTKGVPLRLIGTPGQNGTAASVDSELTLLYRRMTGRPVPPAGVIENPYYLGTTAVAEAKPFSHRTHDIFLVTRLDAFTVEEALALIDRGTAPSTRGAIVLDQRAEPAAAIGDKWMAEAARNVLAISPDQPVVLEQSRQPAASTGEVMGYYSGGSTDTARTGRTSGMKFAAGALAATLVSTDARTFEVPPDSWTPREGPAGRAEQFGGSAESLLADLIREGVTGAAGNVSEPYLQSALRPQILFPAYLAGFNLGEAFYLALPHLGWQSVVIGDPLCAPFPAPGRSLSDLEVPLDPETELPIFFSKARTDTVRLSMKGISPQAVALIVRAESRMQRGDKAGARKALEQATEVSPGAAAAQMQLAMMHEEAGEYDRSVTRYREIIRVEPNNVIALNNLAYALAVRQGSPADALPLARRAATMAPRDPTVVDTLAWVEHLLGNDREAVRLLEPIIRKSTGSAEVHLHAAIVFAAVGRSDIAEAQLRETIRLNPALTDREDVRALRAKLATIRK